MQDVTNNDASNEQTDVTSLFDFNISDEPRTFEEDFEQEQEVTDPDDDLVNHFEDEESDPTANSTGNENTETFTVKIDGEERNVTRDELLAQYQKGVAADRRFEEAATIRKEAEAQRVQYETEAARLQETLGHFTTVAQQWAENGLLTPPSQELLDSDPVRYLKEKAAFEDRLNEVNKAIQAQEYLNQQTAVKQREELSNHILKEQVKLTEFIPEWKNETTRSKEQQELVSYLQKQGYDQQEIEGLGYSRAENISLAVKAMRYDMLKAKAAASKANPTAPTKTVGAQPTKQGQKTSSSVANMKQYVKTGDKAYAQKAIGDLFN